ncbi:MAG: DNA polymerase IV [Microgenomates group bacterium]
MFSHYSWPEAILHIDGDAFFASVMQSAYPHLKGKPIATGKERGIATAFSYEAKRMGVKRGMTFGEIKKVCPSCIYVESDYDLFSLVSKRMFSIIKNYTPYVEEYSIDEAFADIKGMRRMHRKSYEEIALAIKREIEEKLDITVSVGLSITKSLAKLASSFRKPSGFTPVEGKHIEYLLKQRAAQDIWGLGQQTAAYLSKYNVKTALEFVQLPEEFITKHLSKPYLEIWQELHGKKVYLIDSKKKETYQSISKTETFTPPSNDKELLWSYLFQHVEDAFDKARRYKYAVGKIFIFLKTQQFSYRSTECNLLNPTAYPLLIRNELRSAFERVYDSRFQYRTTGCTIANLSDIGSVQTSLFGDEVLQSKTKKLYSILSSVKQVDFATTFIAKREMNKHKEKPLPAMPFLSLEHFS